MYSTTKLSNAVQELLDAPVDAVPYHILRGWLTEGGGTWTTCLNCFADSTDP